MSKKVEQSLSVLLLATFMFGSGCASHFNALPSKQELSKQVTVLEQQYPDVTRYNPTFGRFMFTPIWDMPYADDLVAKWGEPKEKSLSWWNFWSPIVFHNMYRWYWYVDDKRIDVLIDKPLGYGYEPHVFTMIIEDGYGPTTPVVPAAETSAPAPSAAAPAPAAQAGTLTKKLAELNALHESHMLSDTEYESLRTATIEQFK